MRVIDTTIKDLKILKPKIHLDERGFFQETYRENWFKDNICNVSFVQDNYSKSSQATLRGLHYQIKQPQGKLVKVLSGKIFDVAVDMRKSSETFGLYFGLELSAENSLQLWIPPGFAHGFYVMSETAEFFYKCTDYYLPSHEKVVSWNDKNIGINWPLINKELPKLSEKDSLGLDFINAFHFN